jgi:sigma-70-like protein
MKASRVAAPVRPMEHLEHRTHETTRPMAASGSHRRGEPNEPPVRDRLPDALVEIMFEACNVMAVQHRSALYRTALRLTGCPQDADDLVQETYRRAPRLLGTYRPGTNLKAWLIHILHVAYIDRIRTLSRTLGIPLSRLRRSRRAMRRLLMRHSAAGRAVRSRHLVKLPGCLFTRSRPRSLALPNEHPRSRRR